jgi:Fe-Mn family superoxide dismutase
MTFTLPELPFDRSALEPHMSAETFSYHYDKHHNAYVNKANDLVKGTEIEGMDLEDAVRAAAKQGGGVFNNVAQHYNHSFFWNSMTPNGGGEPTGALADKIKATFGSMDEFKAKFKDAGATQFGSGWAWLVSDASGNLEIVKTANADTPLTDGKHPLLTCDVWEHAYYLDYQNRRPDFLSSFLDNLANWEFAAKNYEKATGMSAAA